ncbi:winged helix DNA-binding domain-containing protein [Niabella yanshanensis]|uniref:Winged helix DNA-binding domain-containing protein n=1 Tax=Niabella yanshanensis TaxID=577386 RepID=A0ABZ0W6L2_9BACT|nr:winged helix DNA-binding domain-containing protein [Niabella yanshanensis]WQD38233.1 winged helix DNA-binding domain-containing protein [Niabella yanshanensis]
MKKGDLLQLRLQNQGLLSPRFEKPQDAVAHLGAMQAQDFNMATWAAGLRLKNPGRAAVESAIHSGQLIRTHILRPTWHLVHSKDIRWMMQLSAPYVKKATQFVDKKEGLNDELFKKCRKIIERLLNQADQITKEDILLALSKQRITISSLLTTQIIIRAELEMVLCNGAAKNTYVLFDQRIPPAAALSKTESIVQLAQRYFQSRGPATVKDFAWWSGLGIHEAKTGIAELGPQLEQFIFNDLKYYYLGVEGKTPSTKAVTLLPCYDEYTVGYAEGRAIALPPGLDSAIIGNGIFKPVVLYGNEIVGTWQKNRKTGLAEVQLLDETKAVPPKKLEEGIAAFNRFYQAGIRSK